MKQNNQKTVIARLVGGIGNQLFIYAAARRIAHFNNAQLVLDKYSGFVYDKDHNQYCHLGSFNIKNAVFADKSSEYIPSRAGRFITRLINKLLPFQNRGYIVQEGRDFDPRVPAIKFSRRLFLEGYWQSELYFKDIENIIRNELAIIPPEDETNRKLSGIIENCNSVAIHLRYFDSAFEIAEKNVTEDYYTKAIRRINGLVQDPHYFIFSDKLELSHKFAEKNNIKYTIVDHNSGYKNAYADLWLMSLCKHFVIANSTFSWWGAWLSPSKEKIVISPGMCNNEAVEAWSFEGLIPDKWEILNFGHN